MNRRLTPTPMPTTVAVLDALSRLLLWAVVLAGLVWGTQLWARQMHAPIQRVTVVGDTAHQSELGLRPYLQPLRHANFWTLDLARLAESVNDAPWVRRVTLARDYPAGLRLRLEEHQAVAWWSEANGNRLVNQFGEIFEASLDDATVAASLPVLDGPIERSADLLRAFVQLQTRLQGTPLRAHALRLSPHGSWQATLNDGVELALGREDTNAWANKLTQMTDTLNALRQHYDQNLRSIDLRYPNGFAVSLHGVSVGPQL